MCLFSIRRGSYEKFFHSWTVTLSETEKGKPVCVGVVMSQELCSFAILWAIFLKNWLYNGTDPFSEVSG